VNSINVIETLIKENENVIQQIALGLMHVDDQENLTNIVKPALHKLSEQKDAVGLFSEDPLSFIEL
jgi:hypothetical protein